MRVERNAGGMSLVDVLDRVLDKGVIIDARLRVSPEGIDLVGSHSRAVVTSVELRLDYGERSVEDRR